MQGELILLLSFCFLELFLPWSGHAFTPLPSSLSRKFPGLCYQNKFHSFICPRLFRLAAGGKEKLHMTDVESIG